MDCAGLQRRRLSAAVLSAGKAVGGALTALSPVVAKVGSGGVRPWEADVRVEAAKVVD